MWYFLKRAIDPAYMDARYFEIWRNLQQCTVIRPSLGSCIGTNYARNVSIVFPLQQYSDKWTWKFSSTILHCVILHLWSAFTSRTWHRYTQACTHIRIDVLINLLRYISFDKSLATSVNPQITWWSWWYTGNMPFGMPHVLHIIYLLIIVAYFIVQFFLRRARD